MGGTHTRDTGEKGRKSCRSIPAASFSPVFALGVAGLNIIHIRRVKKKVLYVTCNFCIGPSFAPPPLPPPLQCPHPNKRGTNLLLFKFCIHLHTKVGENQSP